MAADFLQDETRGLRGAQPYRWAKALLSRTVGRAFWYDHLTTAVATAMAAQQRRQRPLNYYEFGTGSGSTLQRALGALRPYPQAGVFLFDSFAGLPAALDERDRSPYWKPGDFAFSEDYIRRLIRRNRFDLGRVHFVRGFFEQSLTPELREQLRAAPPAFVTIDVDYYSSTVTVLDFIKPLLASGTCVYFDDLGAFDCHPGFGQLRALLEFNRDNREGQLVLHPVLGNRIFVYYRNEYEYARPSD